MGFMSKIGKKWLACDARGCEEEVLVHRAEAAGWVVGERDYCRIHTYRSPYAGIDVKERAAAEHVGDP